MERHAKIPGCALGKSLGRVGDPEPKRAVARTVADQKKRAGRDARGQFTQEALLALLREVMQDVEERDVSLEFRERMNEVVLDKAQLLTFARNNFAGLPDFAAIDIVAGDNRLKPAFAQVKRQQPDAAADIQERLVRGVQQVVSRAEDYIAPKFAPDVTLQPALRKERGDARARFFVGRGDGWLVFHLLRIFALPESIDG
jgi:hypothetical protein